MKADASQCQDVCIYGGGKKHMSWIYILNCHRMPIYIFFGVILWPCRRDDFDIGSSIARCVLNMVFQVNHNFLRREWRKYISISFICRTASSSNNIQDESIRKYICLTLVISELLELNWMTAGWKFAAKMPDHIQLNRLSSFITINL